MTESIAALVQNLIDRLEVSSHPHALKMPELELIKQKANALEQRCRKLEDAARRYRYIKRKIYSETSVDKYSGYRHWFSIYDKNRDGLDKVIDAAIRERSND